MSNKERKLYEEIEEGEVNEFYNKETTNSLTNMLKSRQYTSHLKIKEMSEIIETVLNTGEKLVIVDMFKESLYALYEKYKSISGLHTGDKTVEERSEIVKEFQDPDSEMKIFFGSIQTCNYGLTLTAASKLFVLSLPYVPGVYDQVTVSIWCNFMIKFF